MLLWAIWVVTFAVLIAGSITSADEIQTPEELLHDDLTLSPVIMLSRERWQATAEQARRTPAGNELLKQLVARAKRWLDIRPTPIREIVYEGRLEKDAARLETKLALLDMQKLRDLACAYAVTSDISFATSGNRVLLAWIDTCQLTDNPINMNKLAMLVMAYPLLQDQLTPSQRSLAQAWLSKLATLQIKGIGRSQANWESKRFKLIALVGAALGDKRLAEQGVSGLRGWIQHDLRPDGRSLDLELRDAVTYHLGGIVPVLEVAVAVAPLNVDLYRYEAPSGASLQKSVMWVVPYAKGEKPYPQWTNSKTPLDRQRWEAGDPHYRPGRLWEPIESLTLFELATLLDPPLQSVVAQLKRPGAQDLRWIRLLMNQQN